MTEKQVEQAAPALPVQRSRVLRPMKSLKRRAVDAFGMALYGLALGLILLTGWAAYENVVKAGWGADAAAWVQAAGSIAAIAGAAWLAQTDARRSRRERRRQNEEAAWYVRFAIAQAQFESHVIAAELVNRTTPIEKDDVRRWRSQAMTAATGLNALVGKTDHIHPIVTQVTANAKILMDELLVDLGDIARAVDAGTQPDQILIGRIVSPHHALSELLATYDERMDGVGMALDEGGDALPLRRWRVRK